MSAISLDDLEAMWAADAKMDLTEPSKEMTRIPVLHAKYRKHLNHHTLMVKKLLGEAKRLEQVKFDYYSGDLNNPEDLAEYGLDPWPKKVLRTDIPKYIARDKDIIDLNMKISLHTQIAETCESILKELNNRTFQLNGLIKWEMYLGGAN
jgi:hypothetical protein